MKCLSVKQPWAWMMFNDSGVDGVKDIENRTWNTKFRGTVAIQASQKIDKAAYFGLKELMGYNLPDIKDLEVGKIIGILDIIDVVSEHSSIWKEPNSIGFVLDKQKKLIKPISLKGKLGFFSLSEDIINEINRQTMGEK